MIGSKGTLLAGIVASGLLMAQAAQAENVVKLGQIEALTGATATAQR